MEESKSDGSKSTGNNSQRRVGLVYDERMCKHYTSDGDYHPEQPNRIKAIWDKLQTAGIPQRCVDLDAREAEDKHLMLLHSKNHVNLIKSISSKQFESRRERIASQFNPIYFNEGSSEAAYVAAGSVIEVVEKVASRELNSGVAIVRPPGHHAEQAKAMGLTHSLISSSNSETEDDKDPCDSENLTDVLQGVIEPLSKLEVGADSHDQETAALNSWRSELSNIYVWYASFGSNMWKSRFLCYIIGGQVEGMQKQCRGSRDRTPPKEILWKTFPCRLFFGREYSHSWGPGGVAFIDPEGNSQDNTYMCLYKISLEQFNDVLLQENGLGLNIESPLFNLTALNAAKRNEFACQEVVKGTWYGNIMYLGMEQDIPVVTMTCSLSDIGGFKSGKLTLCSPSKAYANTLINGLVQGRQLTEMEAIAYIEAADRPL